MITFIEKKAFANLDEADFAYLQMIAPSWMMSGDPLYEQLESLGELYLKGKLVWGCVVQANSQLLSEETPYSCPAEVLYDPTGTADTLTLQMVAQKLYALKHTTPDDPELKEYAEHITNEKTRKMGIDAPRAITNLPLKTTVMFIWRMHLPNGVLQQLFPILINEKTGVGTVYPAIFWNKDTYNEWISHATYSANMHQGVRELYKTNNEIWKNNESLFLPKRDTFCNIRKIDTPQSTDSQYQNKSNQTDSLSKEFVQTSISHIINERKLALEKKPKTFNIWYILGLVCVIIWFLYKAQ